MKLDRIEPRWFSQLGNLGSNKPLPQYKSIKHALKYVSYIWAADLPENNIYLIRYRKGTIFIFEQNHSRKLPTAPEGWPELKFYSKDIDTINAWFDLG